MKISEIKQIDNASQKLLAFMTALEINCIDDFFGKADVEDYIMLGNEMTKRIKFLCDRVEKLEKSMS